MIAAYTWRSQQAARSTPSWMDLPHRCCQVARAEKTTPLRPAMAVPTSRSLPDGAVTEPFAGVVRVDPKCEQRMRHLAPRQPHETERRSQHQKEDAAGLLCQLDRNIFRAWPPAISACRLIIVQRVEQPCQCQHLQRGDGRQPLPTVQQLDTGSARGDQGQHHRRIDSIITRFARTAGHAASCRARAGPAQTPGWQCV
jgi:hypothetical protein